MYYGSNWHYLRCLVVHSPLGVKTFRPFSRTLKGAILQSAALVKETLAWHSITPSLIPSGTAGLIQVVDVCVNRSFNAMLKDVMDEIIDGLGEEALLWLGDASESAVGRRRVLMTRAVGEAWKRVSAIIQVIVT